MEFWQRTFAGPIATYQASKEELQQLSVSFSRVCDFTSLALIVTPSKKLKSRKGSESVRCKAKQHCKTANILTRRFIFPRPSFTLYKILLKMFHLSKLKHISAREGIAGASFWSCWYTSAIRKLSSGLLHSEYSYTQSFNVKEEEIRNRLIITVRFMFFTCCQVTLRQTLRQILR